MKKTLTNKIRIISGKHRGRKINVLNRPDLRPSPERVRETLFNWLQNEISGAQVFDGFAGSGAIGLEALSRGASSVLFCEQDTQASQAIRETLIAWRESHARVLQSDCMTLTANPTRYDLIFLDPPFSAGLHQACIDKFATDSWLKPYGKIYIESAEPLQHLTLPSNWIWHKTSKAGQVHFGLINKENP